MVRRLTCAIAALALTAGCGSQPVHTANTGTLQWSQCTDLPDQATGDLDCAVLPVPVDYAKPGGDRLELALVRRPATGSRQGSLIIATGEPGTSGVDALAQAADTYTDLGKHYDLIGYDPRGAARSAPVTCRTDRQTDQDRTLDDSPDAAAEESQLVASAQSYVQGCQHGAGPILPYVGTQSAARDLDQIRQATGDTRLNLLGVSYGARLGGAYAHMFPATTGRMVLDGPSDPGLSPREAALQRAAGFQQALAAYTTSCAKDHDHPCHFTAADVAGLLNRLDQNPLPAAGGRHLTQTLAADGIKAALPDAASWPALTIALDQALKQGSGTTLLEFADARAGRDSTGAYANTAAADTAVACADTRTRYTTADVHAALPAFQAASPVFGADAGWGLLRCAGWPVPGTDTTDIDAPAAPRILVIGGRSDPVTPYEQAASFTRRLGGPGVLLTYQGPGHGAYDSGDRCVRSAVDRYLLKGTVPASGTSCP